MNGIVQERHNSIASALELCLSCIVKGIMSVVLIHLPLDKMAAMSQTTFSNEFPWISLKFVPESPIDSKSALVQLMVWRRTDDKPLPEPVLTQFTDAYMCH